MKTKEIKKANGDSITLSTPTPKKTHNNETKSKKAKTEKKRAFSKKSKKQSTSKIQMSEIPIYQRIKTKLIASFMLLIVCIVILGASSYTKSAKGITSNYEESAGQTMQMIVQYLDLVFNNVKTTYQPYMSNSKEFEFDYYFKGVYLSDNIKHTTTYNSIKQQISKLVTADPLVSNFYQISDTVTSLTTTQSNTEKLYSLYIATPEGAEAKTNRYVYYWLGVQPELDEALKTPSNSYAVRLVRHFQGSNTLMLVDIKRSVVVDTLSSLDAGEGSVVALITQDNKEVLSNEAFSPDGAAVFTDKEFFATALAGEEEHGSADVTVNDIDYLFLYHKLTNQNAIVCSLIPKSHILSQVTEIRNNTVILVIISSLLAIFLGTYFANGIGSTISNVTHQLRKVAKGDLTVAIQTKRKDEFKLLTEGITDMISNMKLLIQNVSDMSMELTEAAAFVSDSSSTFMQTSQDIQYAISDIESGVNQLDLDSADCLSQMDALSGKISTVSNNTTEISKLTAQTNISIRDGMNSMEGLNESALATSQITTKVIIAIEQLEERSRSIGHIVDAINEIAEETNLLSLNASIEAARAGEAGRGFSVVAEQIRKLADQSLNSAKEINKIIEQMIEQTHDVVETAKQAETIVDTQKDVVNTTTSSFNEMSEQITNLVSSLTTITSDVSSMGVSRDTTLSAIESISAISEETSAASSNVATTAVTQLESVQKLDVAASNLAKRAEELTQLLQQFNL